MMYVLKNNYKSKYANKNCDSNFSTKQKWFLTLLISRLFTYLLKIYCLLSFSLLHTATTLLFFIFFRIFSPFISRTGVPGA